MAGVTKLAPCIHSGYWFSRLGSSLEGSVAMLSRSSMNRWASRSLRSRIVRTSESMLFATLPKKATLVIGLKLRPSELRERHRWLSGGLSGTLHRAGGSTASLRRTIGSCRSRSADFKSVVRSTRSWTCGVDVRMKISKVGTSSDQTPIPAGALPSPALEASVNAALEQLHFPREVDRDFFTRVFTTPQQIYEGRLRALGISGLGLVLDAGSGFGQWSLAAAELNAHVCAIDVDPFRTATLNFLKTRLRSERLSVVRGSLGALPFGNSEVDAIFCYSAIFMGDFRRAMQEAYRVLAPGGRLYYTANSFGWYLHNLLRGQNAAEDFSPRDAALRACRDSIRFYLTHTKREGPEVLVPQAAALRAARRAGFTAVTVGPEGSIHVDPAAPPPYPLFARRRFGLTSVYEMLCEKG